MEISRKKITDSEIHAAEAELCAKVNGVMADFSEKFDTLGYELDAEFSRDNENLDDEEREALRATELTDACEYSFGYASGVKITVKRKKSEEAQEAEQTAEELSEEEAELAENERLAEEVNREVSRNVAFTSMYFVHIYKAFWRESVSISENANDIRNDLEEFLGVLAEKANGAETENEAE
jgi:hypothetical protein